MRQKINKFMSGRYGQDELNIFILIIQVIFYAIYMISNNSLFLIPFYFCIYLFVYRSFSKKIYSRRKERDIYLRIKVKIMHHIKAFFINMKDKEHKTVVCPKCAQMIRVPKNKGNIEVKCPSCKSKFDAKS